jgi:hypothetical protein
MSDHPAGQIFRHKRESFQNLHRLPFPLRGYCPSTLDRCLACALKPSVAAAILAAGAPRSRGASVGHTTKEAALHSILPANNRDPGRSVEGPNSRGTRKVPATEASSGVPRTLSDDMTLSIPTRSG